MPNNSTNDELQAARDRARLAMGGEKIQEKQIEDEKTIKEKLSMARLAMEGPERRLRRETREKEAIDKETMRKRIDEEVKRRVAETAQKKLAEEAERQREKQAREQELKQKENQLAQSRNVIEQLKKEKGSSLHPLRTLQSDLAGAVQTENLSVAKIAISEQKKTPTPVYTMEKSSSGVWKKVFFFFVIFTLLLAGGAGGYWYWINKEKTSGPSTVVIQSIVYAETSREIDTAKISPAQLIPTISDLISTPATTGETISNLYFTKEVPSSDGKTKNKALLSFSEWLKYSQSSIPEDFSRFVNDYMVGLHKGLDQNSVFLTLKIDLHDNVYQALMDHEGDYVQNILKSLDGQDVAGTSTKRTFSDRRIKNIDTRTLTDEQGKILMLYSFLDRNTLVIAKNENALYRAYVAYNNPRPKN